MKRTSGFGKGCILTLVAVAMLVQPVCAEGQGVSVRYREGSLRGFLVLERDMGRLLISPGGEAAQPLPA
jgi:hypothetical protein